MNDKDIHYRILSALEKQSAGIMGTPLYKIAINAGLSRATASKYCHILAAQNKIKMETFGNMKIVSRPDMRPKSPALPAGAAARQGARNRQMNNTGRR